MEALPLRAGRANCMSNIQQDMIEQTLAILASMMQQAAHDATLYCAEAKRTVIMPRDIELAAACIGKASEPIGAYTSNAKGITWNM